MGTAVSLPRALTEPELRTGESGPCLDRSLSALAQPLVLYPAPPRQVARGSVESTELSGITSQAVSRLLAPQKGTLNGPGGRASRKGPLGPPPGPSSFPPRHRQASTTPNDTAVPAQTWANCSCRPRSPWGCLVGFQPHEDRAGEGRGRARGPSVSDGLSLSGSAETTTNVMTIGIQSCHVALKRGAGVKWRAGTPRREGAGNWVLECRASGVVAASVGQGVCRSRALGREASGSLVAPPSAKVSYRWPVC